MELVQWNYQSSNFSDLPLYPNSLLGRYNIRRSYENLCEIVDQFIDLQCKYLNIMPPRITQDYKVVYTSYKVADVVGNHVAKRLDTLDEIKRFYNQLARALSLLNHDEMVYFIQVLYGHNSESLCAEILNITTYKLKQIKESCVIKMTKALNNAVLK